MKSIFSLVMLLSLTFIGRAQEVDLTGAWENKQLQVEYEFSGQDKLYFSQMGYGVPTTYSIDTSVEPHQLKLTIKQGGQEVVIPALLKYVDNNTIWIEQFPPFSDPPTQFSTGEASKAQIHVLHRKL